MDIRKKSLKEILLSPLPGYLVLNMGMPVSKAKPYICSNKGLTFTKMSAKVANKYLLMAGDWAGREGLVTHVFKKNLLVLKNQSHDGCPELFALRTGQKKKKKKQ